MAKKKPHGNEKSRKKIRLVDFWAMDEQSLLETYSTKEIIDFASLLVWTQISAISEMLPDHIHICYTGGLANRGINVWTEFD